MSRASGLPPGWTTARLEDLFATITDGDHQPPPQSPTGVPFIVIGDIRNGSINLSDARFVKTAYYNSLPDQKKPARGDLLYTVTGSFGIPVVVSSDEHFCVQRHIAILKPAQAANVRYIGLALSTSAALQQATALATGTAQKTVGLGRLRSITVPLAPTEEQQRILDTLDSLLSRLDSAVASLERARAKLKAYRVSVLKAAVEGRLVPTEADLARKEGRSYEPADELLVRMLKERRRRWEEAEQAKMRAAGKAPKDDRWKAKYPEPEQPDTRNLPSLPEGWCWATVDQLSAKVFYGSSAKAGEESDGVPILRMGNIIDGSLALSYLKYLPLGHEEFPDLLLESGDLLFNRTNSPELVGKSALYAGTPSPCSFASYLICARFLSGIEPHWVAHVINSPFGRQWIWRVVTQQVGQANVNGSKLKALAIPLPPFEEQRACASTTDMLFSNADVVQDTVQREVLRISRLRQSILKLAFEGRLADQDRADEPADALLARIRAERSAAVPAARKPRRARKLKVAS
jgi:type I restriction enzyme, S subunit